MPPVPTIAAGVTVAPVTVPPLPATVHTTGTVKAVEEVTVAWNVALIAVNPPVKVPVVTPAMVIVSPVLSPWIVEVLTVHAGLPMAMLEIATRGVRPVAAGLMALLSRSLEPSSCWTGTRAMGFR